MLESIIDITCAVQLRKFFKIINGPGPYGPNGPGPYGPRPQVEAKISKSLPFVCCSYTATAPSYKLRSFNKSLHICFTHFVPVPQ